MLGSLTPESNSPVAMLAGIVVLCGGNGRFPARSGMIRTRLGSILSGIAPIPTGIEPIA
jgi:hypothetical protein